MYVYCGLCKMQRRNSKSMPFSKILIKEVDIYLKFNKSYNSDALSWKYLSVQLLAAIEKKKTADPDGGGDDSHQTEGGQQRQRSMSVI